MSTVNLVGQEKVDMIREIKDSNSVELARLREDYDPVRQKALHLEAEVEASQNLAREVCAERDELRNVLDDKSSEFQTENDEFTGQAQALLAELSALTNGDVDDSSKKSPTDLLKQFAELTEKNIDKLAARAEVSVSSLFFLTRLYVSSPSLRIP